MLKDVREPDAPAIHEAPPPGRPAAIRTVRLAKDFGDTKALKELDLEVPRGIVFGLLGPNGAGKTTMIRLLLDLIRPTGGSAEVLGLDCQADSLAVRGRCGYLPGDLKLPARRTSRQYLDHMARLRGGVDEDFVVELAARLGLDLNRQIGDQSKGNRQKVGLVSAFMSRPELLILDEPTSGLDPIRQHDVQEMMRESAAAGATVLLSSHDLDQVENVAERVGIIREGSLVALEEVSDLRDRATREVEVRFAGDVPFLGGIDGVFLVDKGDDFVRLRVTGPMDELVKTLAKSSVVTLNSSRPELDEIFLSFYEGRDER